MIWAAALAVAGWLCTAALALALIVNGAGPQPSLTDRVNAACARGYLVADFYPEGGVIRVQCEARDVNHEPFAYTVAVER